MYELISTNTNLFFAGVGAVCGSLLTFLCMIFVNTSKILKCRAEYERLSADMSQNHDYELNQLNLQLVRQETQLIESNKIRAADQEKLKTLSELERRYIQLQTRYDEQKKQILSEHALLDETKKTLFKEFELSANKIFDDKHHTFQQSSKTNIELVLNPFKQQLDAFHKRVEDVYHQESTQRNQLVGQIVELQKHTQHISQEANNLAEALKGDSKAQGDWGEVILERILEQSGLVKGREYDVQNTGRGDDGRVLRPDVIVHLPENKDIIIDSKVSLKHYEKYYSSESSALRKQFLSLHVDSIRKHIKDLSSKKYEQIKGLRTLDFVFIFIPIESAYLSAMSFQPSLFNEAYEKNIVLVSPSSLMVALRTVETIWRYEKQNENAELIAATAGKLYDQFALVMESLESLEGSLSKASDAYTHVFKRFTSGRGSLLSRVNSLKKLGAKTSKKLPQVVESELGIHEQKSDDILVNNSIEENLKK